jgi:hypothetical protein
MHSIELYAPQINAIIERFNPKDDFITTDLYLKMLVEGVKSESTAHPEEMTANMFFSMCEICYDANDYFKNAKKPLSSSEKYINMADGRDAGLRNITLAGSSVVRVEETVRMAVALFKNKIPFELRDWDEIVRMVTGTDFIGIVPDKFLARYCHSLFPKEDKIIDFMNPGFDNEIIPKIIEKAFWYPPDEIILA